VYGERQGGPFREDDPVLHPISPYAATKRAGELLAHSFHHSQGLSITCARIFTAYGPRQRPDLAVRKFAERMLRDEPIPVYGDGGSLRDFTYVDDLVEGLVRALDRDLGFAILNFGAGRTLAVIEMVKQLEQALGVKAQIEWRPRETGDVTRTWADVSAAHAKLGWSANVPFEAGIQRFVAWLRGRMAARSGARQALVTGARSSAVTWSQVSSPRAGRCACSTIYRAAARPTSRTLAPPSSCSAATFATRRRWRVR
jgi:UDP-glucuronate 4-epimerase